MNNHQIKQHQCVLLLTLAVFSLVFISLWQQGLAPQLLVEKHPFEPGTLFYALCAAFVFCMVVALTFIHNSSSELNASSKLSLVDELTSMANQRKFDKRLKQELSRVTRHGGAVWLMHFDLDHIKDINDCYGREAGDMTITEFGHRLQSILRVQDDATWIAEDDFVAMLTDVENDKVIEIIADRLTQVMRQPFVFGDTKIYCSVSIGAAIVRDGASDPTEAIKQANFALLQAKNDGRSQLKIFEPSMAKRIMEKRSLQSDLRNALENGEIYVEYQPIVAQNTGEIVGSEALIRWAHPKRGVISPEVFINIAEETGIIHELGEFVLTQACIDFREIGSLKLAVNVSPIQFKRADFIDRVKWILEKTGFDPERLEIEITEGIFISDPDKAKYFIKCIKDWGIKVALDDFGTGYSSLSYLQDFSFNRIKIDRSFISKIDESVEAERLVSTMIDMGESLGFDVTIEGVETAAQLKKLDKYNYSEMQGFLFSRPVGISQFQNLYTKSEEKHFENDEEHPVHSLKLVG